MPGSTGSRYLLLYGSQTGQAKAIAEEIFERSSEHGLYADLHCLSMTDKKFSLEKEKCVVLVTSTTGDGEPPDTAIKFVRRIKKKTLPDDHFAHLNFTVLGLGDTNYTNFCNNAKVIDRRLCDLGGQRFYPSGFADEAVGLEVVVDPWIDGLFPALQKFLDVDTSIHPLPQRVPPSASDASCSASPNCSLSIDLTDMAVTTSLEKDQSENANVTNLVEDRVSDSERTSGKSGRPAYGVVSWNDADTDKRNGSINEDRSSEKSALDSEYLNKSQREEQPGEDVALTLNSVVMSVRTESSEPCLRKSVPPLSEGGLTLPAVTPPFLAVNFLPPDEGLEAKLSSLPWQNDYKLPSAAAGVVMAKIVSAQRLTADDAAKKTLLLRLGTEKCGLKYCPGDAISIVCANYDEEVNQLISRLCLGPQADQAVQLSVMPDTKKRRAAIPPYFPEDVCSLRYILKTCVDIREPPKKALLRTLVDFTSDAEDKRRLQELCSKEGAPDYSAFVRGENVSLLDVLCTFPSCHPPVERILEHLSRLQPRPYSACSAPEWNPGFLDVAFNVVDIPRSASRVFPRRGLCTGWLDDATQTLQNSSRRGSGDAHPMESLSGQMQTMALDDMEVPVCTRTNQNFRLPADLSVPIIMIGPGTGVAPFIGFLQERQLRKKELADPATYGETWLLFGCRNRGKDFLFRHAIEEFQASGTLTNFLPSFSRDGCEGDRRYVQDSIRSCAANICQLIDQKEALVYVCGDARNMAKDVNTAFEEVLQQHKGLNADESKTYLMNMRINRRYLEDVWT